MKKRILFVTILLSVFFAFIYSVYAIEPAKAPTTVPPIGTKMYAATDGILDTEGRREFDFSAVSFKNGTETLKGKEDLEKIKIATDRSLTSLPDIKLADDWFTAYCLDPNLLYPHNGLSTKYLLSSVAAAAGTGDFPKAVVDDAVIAALFNSGSDSRIKALLTALPKGFLGEVDYTYPDGYDGADRNRTLLEAALGTSNSTPEANKVKVGFKSLTIVDNLGNPLANGAITGQQINQALDIKNASNGYDEEYKLELSQDTMTFDLYTTKAMESNVKNNHILWIIEHSYPAISMDRLFTEAGVVGSTLRSEVLGLAGNTGLTDDEKVENYVYSTIQYAIWYVAATGIDGNTIGNELVSTAEADASKVVELNKLYQYLIKDRDIYATYANESNEFGDTLTIRLNKGDNKNIYHENNKRIKYGPYIVTSNMVTAGTISLSIRDNVEGVTIVNAADTVITSVKEGEEFFINIDKEKIKKATDRVIVVAKTTEGITYESNRGRVYEAYSPLVQNVASGGKATPVSKEAELKIDVNVHTGLVNIAGLFVMTMIVFSLGYLLLSYTNKKVELS